MPSMSAPVNYKDDPVKRIESRLHTVWIIITPTEKRVAIWSKDTQIEDVHRYCAAILGSKFKIGQLGTGAYIISQTDSGYVNSMDDGRFVNQDWDVSLSACLD